MEREITPAEVLLCLADPDIEEMYLMWIEPQLVLDGYEDVIVEATIWASGTEVHIDCDNANKAEQAMEAEEFIESYNGRRMWLCGKKYVGEIEAEEIE
jgi:hypothetical protein